MCAAVGWIWARLGAAPAWRLPGSLIPSTVESMQYASVEDEEGGQAAAPLAVAGGMHPTEKVRS